MLSLIHISWRSRLRPEAVEWEDALCCAAAFTAAADYRLSRRGDGIDAFTAGAVSIKAGAVADSAALSTALRLAAERDVYKRQHPSLLIENIIAESLLKWC